jgi:hypothetical protein
MPYCPKCRYEYRKGITNCPDCGEWLVDDLPDAIDEDSYEEDSLYEDWLQLARLTSYQYAEMIIEGLRSKNIPAVILTGGGYFGHTGQMGISSSLPIGGGYSIMVPRDFAAEADTEAELILGDEWKKARLVDPEDL